MTGVCTWVTAVLDCLGCAGESGPQSPTQAAIRVPLSHQGQSSEESPSTPHCRKINDSILELYAPTSASAEMEILFFHGLQLGGTSDPHISTWQSRSAQKAVWPGEWLPEDFPKARILSISYDGSLTRDATSGRMDMYLVAESVLQNCLLAGVGQLSPVILVGHSFGGLVIKQLCVNAHRKRSHQPKIKTFFGNVKAIFYFATPHHGSHLGSAIEKLSSKEGDLLSHVKVFSKDLARLNSDFSSISRQWLVSGLGEALPTKLGREFNDVVVEEGSARCENFFIVQENHISICQPETRDSTTYQHLSYFIRGVQQKFTGEPHYPYSTVRGSQTYVPIHIQARDRIISGLENEQGPAVILLHGDPGSGKSVLARFIGESYARSRGAADPGSIFLSVPRISRKLVIFLECGQSADSKVLLQKLHEKLHPEVHRSQDQCGSGSMCRNLPFLMMGQRIIIVLDDVWNPELMDAVLEEVRGCGGAHVKILVTSRRSDLSSHPEILKVKTEEVTYTEAEKILASHLGLASIPQNLQKYAKLLVEKSGKHPLALAMVASRITRDMSEDPKEWEAVAKSYSALLRKQLQAALVRQGKQGIMHFGSVLDCAYRRSIGETLMLTYEDMEPDSRYLLLLIAKCRASSIPSSVVGMLFAYGVANHHRYSGPELSRFALRDLQNSGAMLRVSKRRIKREVQCKFSTSFGDKQFTYESLSMHDLQKEFLNVLMEEDNERLEKSLVADSHCSVSLEDSGKMTSEELDRATVWILCVLWLRQDLAERAAEKLGVRLPLFGSLSIPVLRDALEPLTWLMHEDFGEKMIRCAQQVMVQFFLYGGFDDQSLSTLSTYRDTVSATGRMLLRIVHYTRHSGEDCDLLAVSPMDVHSSRTSGLLNGLSSHQENTNALLEVPDTIARLVKLLVNSSDDCLRDHVLQILITLSRDSLDVQLQIGGTAGAILELVTILSSENHPRLQRGASALLGILIDCDENRNVLLEVSDIVARLTNILVNRGDSGDNVIFTNFTGIMGRLSNGNPDVQHQVGGTPGVIPKLLTVLFSENPRDLQQNASALVNILSSHQENRKALLEVPDTVAGLVKLLVNRGDDDLLVHVAGILVNLSFDNPDVQHQVGGTTGVIVKLLTVLSSGNPSDLQVHASWLLNILSSLQENRKVLLETPDTIGGTTGVIAKLLTVLSSRNPSDLQVNSRLLGNASLLLSLLINCQENDRKTLLEIPDALARLVKLLVNSGDDDLLANVSGVLASLSMNNPDVKHQVGGTPGLIPKLLTVLFSDARSLHNASVLLYTLTDRGENTKAVLEVPDAVARLVKLFVNGGDDELLTHIGGILCHVSLNNRDVQHQIGGMSGAIQKMLAMLNSTTSPQVQSSAGSLLFELCKCEDNTRRIGGTPGAISSLLTILLCVDSSSVRLEVSGLLFRLSSFQANRKLFLELPGGLEELVKLFVDSERVELLSNLAGVLNNLLQENPALESQIGKIMSSNPRPRTSRNLYSASGGKKLSLGQRRAMHYEYLLFSLRFGFRPRKSLSFPGVSCRWDAVG